MVTKALEFEPTNASYLDTKGWVLYKLEKYVQARKFLEQAFEADRNWEIADHLGHVYLKLRKLDLARKYWNEAMALNPARRSEFELKISKID